MTPEEFGIALAVVANREAPDKERLATAARLLNSRLCNVIPRDRWKAFQKTIKQELARSAHNHRTTTKEELWSRQLAAVFLVSDIGETDPKEVRKEMANILSDCLMGPGWNQRKYNESLDALLDESIHDLPSFSYDPWDAIISRIDAERTIETKGNRLNRMEQQAIEAAYMGERFVDVARLMNVPVGTIGAAFHRARKKLARKRLAKTL